MAAAFHLTVRCLARTVEEEGAGELAGGWSLQQGMGVNWYTGNLLMINPALIKIGN